jgi:uncharacterized Zn-binding protein involved in type VI secretion
MPFIARLGIDTHIGHACVGGGKGHPKPFHRTPYVATAQGKVTVNGALAVTIGGATACGDVAVGGSVKVFAGGVPVHRVGDPTSGHLCHFVPNACATGSPTVIAWT